MDGQLVVELAALALDAAALLLCANQLLRARRLLGDLHSAPTLEIDKDLKNKLKNQPNNTLKYVVLRGIVKPLGNSIKSNTNDKISGVIQKVTMKEHVVARTTTGFWSDESRTVYEMSNIMPFVISGKNVDVEIIDALEANILDMDIISDKFEPLTPSLLDHIWGYFSGVRQKGLQTTEEMLRDGTLITAIGELNIKDDGMLKLQPPKDGSPLFLVTSTKSSLVKKITDSKDLLRISIMIFGSVAIFLSTRMLIKYMRRRKKLRAEEDVKNKLAVSRRERRQLARESNLSDVQLCVVCTENPKEIILLPCGHVCLCEDCSDNIKDKCPVCRVEIDSKAAAYIT